MAFSLRSALLFTFACIVMCFVQDESTQQDHHHKLCKKILGQLARQQAAFVQCTIDNSTPAMSCTDCFQPYEDMNEEYGNLVTNCSDLYINQNRLNIVSNVQSTLVDIWNKAFCYDCFEDETHSNSTDEFRKRKTEFDNCLGRTEKNETCIDCKPMYISLNDFYKNMAKEKEGKICFDIQDAMNRSRSTWSKDLKCCRREYSMTLFIVASTLFGAVPFVFYLGMYGYTKRTERNHEVLDSNYNSENQEAVASTSAGASSSTLPNLQRQPETRTSIEAPENINDVVKQKVVSTEGQDSSIQNKENSLIIL